MIYDILPVNNYQGNDSATTFDFDFYIEDNSQLKVYHFDKNSLKSLLVEGVDYSINEFKNNNGSYITFPLAGSEYGVLASDEKISLELSLPVSQETQYNNSSLLNLEALEYSFDYLTRLVQILARKIELCVKVEECSENTPEELIETINSQSLSAVNASNASIQALNAVNEIKNTIVGINNEIQTNKDKFDKIDTIDTIEDELEVQSGQINALNTSLTSYAKCDFSNITQEAKSQTAGYSVPDYDRATIVSYEAWVLAPYDCFIYGGSSTNTSSPFTIIKISNPSGIMATSGFNDGTQGKVAQKHAANCAETVCAFVPKGYSFMIEGGDRFKRLVMCPLKGAY